MGLWNVLEWLDKHPGKWYTSSDLVVKMKCSMSNISTSLSKLRKSRLVHCRLRHEGWRQTYEYSSKKKTSK